MSEYSKKFSVAAHDELPLCEFNLRSVKSFLRSALTDIWNSAIEETGKAVIEAIEKNGHQQKDDTIWCPMDVTLDQSRTAISKLLIK